MKKIVVFGATGNIGAYFVDYCKNRFDAKNYEVIAVGRKKTSFFDSLGVKYYQVDIRDESAFENLPKEDIYAVVNLAGVLPAYYSRFDPFTYIDINISGALQILEYARQNHADRVLYTQTWAELAGHWGKSEVLSPDMDRRLVYRGDHAFYAITKSMVADTMEFYKQEYGLKNFVFRLPNIYLYSPQEFYFVNGVQKKISYRYLIEKAARGEDIELWGDENAFKDIIYVKDLCQMMYLALFARVNGGIYHAGTGVRTTLKQQIEGIVDVFSPKENPSKIIHCPEKESFVSFVMDIENAKTELGYKPLYLYKDYLIDYKKEREQKRFNKLWEN